MLRMKEFFCEECGTKFERIVRLEDRPAVRHCGKPARGVIVAPAVKFLEPHFNKGLGVWVNDAQDLDRKLAERGSFIPTKLDLARAIENAPGEPTADHKPDPEIRATAEKVRSRLHGEMKI